MLFWVFIKIVFCFIQLFFKKNTKFIREIFFIYIYAFYDLIIPHLYLCFFHFQFTLKYGLVFLHLYLSFFLRFEISSFILVFFYVSLKVKNYLVNMYISETLSPRLLFFICFILNYLMYSAILFIIYLCSIPNT